MNKLYVPNLRKISINKKSIKEFYQDPAKLFASIALIFGLIMMFLMPLFKLPDEHVHFYRAYQIGEGHLTSENMNGETGGYVREVRSDGNYSLQPEQAPEKFISFPSSALYSPIAYIPQAIGIDIGRLINPTVETMVYFGRFVNLIFYIILVFLAIRIAKMGKWVYTAVGLFPVAIQQAASLSTDVMTTGLVFITIALTHRLFLQSTRITSRQLMLLGLLAIGLGLTKQTNIVILLPLLFLSVRLFGDFKSKILSISPVLLACVVAMGSWALIMKLNNYNTDYPTTLGLTGVDPPEQVRYLISHPLSFIETAFRSFIFEGFKSPPTSDFYILSAFGFFSTLTYKLPIIFIFTGYITLVIALLYKDGDKNIINAQLSKKLAAIGGLTFFLSVAAVAVALYIVWTVVGAPQIAGIQGRYFIPLLPLLIPVFQYFGSYVVVSFKKPFHIGYLIGSVSVVNLIATVAISYRWFY